MKIRLGAVCFLNTRPLTAALEPEDPFFEVSYAVPSACAAQLQAGQIDVGLIPSIEYARSQVPYCLVPEVAIACRGEVLSVQLFFRGPLERIRRVALDPSSRTSAALVQILLRERYGLSPEFVEAPPASGRRGPEPARSGSGHKADFRMDSKLEAMLAGADAALLIGDSALRHLGGELSNMDLGQEWKGFTGYPFVFAFWAGRQGALAPAQVQRLVEARRQGAGQIPAIARKAARELGPGFAQEQEVLVVLFERYLTQHIRFELGEEELAGLRCFYALAYQHGLISGVPELRFFEKGVR